MAKGIYKRGNIFWIRYAGLDGKTLYESTGSVSLEMQNICTSRERMLSRMVNNLRLKKLETILSESLPKNIYLG